jgi:hypothetical protein
VASRLEAGVASWSADRVVFAHAERKAQRVAEALDEYADALSPTICREPMELVTAESAF